MQFLDLLCIRSKGVGLPGPYIQENMAPYKVFDQLGNNKPRLILLLRGHEQRRDDAKDVGTLRKFTIGLARHGGNIVASCAMHQQPDHAVTRILAVPVPGNYCYHLVENPPQTMANLAYRLYCDVFALFSDIILISVAEFGGLEKVMSFISFWIQRQRLQSIRLRAHFVLVTNQYQLRDVEFRLLAAMLADQRQRDPSSPESVGMLKSVISSSIELSTVDDFSLGPGMIKMLCKRRNFREAEGLHFTASNAKLLLRASIAHWTRQPTGTFDMVAAARLSCPIVPTDFGCRIRELLACTPEPAAYYTIIASALVMDAYVPGMHREY